MVIRAALKMLFLEIVGSSPTAPTKITDQLL